jgi:hypothetical protein
MSRRKTQTPILLAIPPNQETPFVHKKVQPQTPAPPPNSHPDVPRE